MNGISATDLSSRDDYVTQMDPVPTTESQERNEEADWKPTIVQQETFLSLYQKKLQQSLLVSKPVPISSSAFPVERIRMATNARGDAAMAYVRFGGDQNYAYVITKKTGEFWGTPVEIDRGGDIEEISCGINSKGAVRLLWEVDGQRKMAWQNSDGKWIQPISVDPLFTMDTDDDLISHCLCGENAISLIGRDAEDSSKFCCATYFSKEGQFFERITHVPAFQVDMQSHPDQGNALVWTEENGIKSRLHLACWNEASGSWVSHPVVSLLEQMKEPQLFLGSNQQQEIVWRNDNQIRILSLNGGKATGEAVTVGELQLTSGWHVRNNESSCDWQIRFAQDSEGNQIMLWNTLKDGRDVIYAASRLAGKNWQAPKELKLLPAGTRCKDLQIQLTRNDQFMVGWTEQTSEFLGGEVRGGILSAKNLNLSRETRLSPEGAACSDARLSAGGKFDVNVCWSQNGPDYLKNRQLHSAEVVCL